MTEAFLSFFLHGTLNATASQTTRADMHSDGFAVHNGMDFLDVGFPDAACLVVGMADVVARHHTLAAYFAIIGHV